MSARRLKSTAKVSTLAVEGRNQSSIVKLVPTSPNAGFVGRSTPLKSPSTCNALDPGTRHVETSQRSPEAQSTSLVHELPHTLPEHAYTPHERVPPSTQVPAPLQVSVSDAIEAAQDAALQTVPLGQSRHVPAPLQLPSVPQLDAALGAHSLCGSLPAGIDPHVPFDPPVSAALHALHVPLHALLQQKPSTQLPLVHWLAPPHMLPLPSLATQWLVASQ
jgi:hypothetical protein